jgi:hypothetical protein
LRVPTCPVYGFALPPVDQFFTRPLLGELRQCGAT